MSSKPRWLIAGGMGFIGRNLVKYLLDNNLASYIRVADKRAMFMAFLSADHKAALENEIVECVQADVGDEEHIPTVFGDIEFDFVVNLAAETDYTKPEKFHAKQVDIARILATQSVKLPSLKKFVQVSTASVYASSAKPVNESGKVSPYTIVAEWSSKAEDTLRSIRGLPLIVLRPAITYGPGDVAGLMPRAVCAAAYTKIDGKMEFLWDGDLKMNTVHVFDVVRAIYFAAKKLDAGSTWNIVDKGDSDQGRISGLLGKIFKIETGFYGSTMSMLAKMKMDSVVDDANSTHLAPWLSLLKEHSIKNTPLSPFLHKQLLQNNSLCVDGAAIEAAGFKYAVPELTEDGLRDEITQAIAQGIFPPVVDGAAAPTAGSGSR